MSARQLRRTLLKTAAAAAFLGASAAVLPPDVQYAQQTADAAVLPEHRPVGSEKELSISSWPAYVDPVDDPDSTLHGFERQTGITVHLTEDITDAQLFFAKVLNQLGACQPVNRDLMILNNPLAARMIALGWLQELDHSAMPNVTANLLPGLRQTVFDPGRRYCLPWQSGFPESPTTPRWFRRSGASASCSPRSMFAGASPCCPTWKTPCLSCSGWWARTRPNSTMTIGTRRSNCWSARDDAARSRPSTAASSGETWWRATSLPAWRGPVMLRNCSSIIPIFASWRPKSLVLWCDNLMIPNRARHKANAEKWINHYYDPEVAARLAAYVYGICPVAGAREAMQGIAPALADNPLIFPSEELLSRSFSMMPLNETRNRRYTHDFTEAMGG